MKRKEKIHRMFCGVFDAIAVVDLKVPSRDDGDDVLENVTSEYNLALGIISSCSRRTMWGKSLQNELCIDNERFTFVGSCCRQNLKFGDFTLLYRVL